MPTMTVDTETEDEVFETEEELPDRTITETSLKQPQCCEIFDRFCFGCRDIAIMNAHQGYRERLRQLMVVPAPGEDPGEKEGMVWKRHPLIPDDVVDLVSNTEDDREGLGDSDVDH